MMRYLRGYAQIMISGAEPERCLNMFAARDVAFWAPEKTDALHLRCRIYQKDLDAALAAEKERTEGGRDSLLRQSVTEEDIAKVVSTCIRSIAAFFAGRFCCLGLPVRLQ